MIPCRYPLDNHLFYNSDINKIIIEHRSVVPFLQAWPGKIKHLGYCENKQTMYDLLTDVYHSSEFETWGYIKAECALTNTTYHGNEKTDGVLYMNNDEILTRWMKII